MLQSIISRLSEHRLQLPDTFGSYKLLEWNAEPSSKRYIIVTCACITSCFIIHGSCNTEVHKIQALRIEVVCVPFHI